MNLITFFKNLSKYSATDLLPFNIQKVIVSKDNAKLYLHVADEYQQSPSELMDLLATHIGNYNLEIHLVFPGNDIIKLNMPLFKALLNNYIACVDVSKSFYTGCKNHLRDMDYKDISPYLSPVYEAIKANKTCSRYQVDNLRTHLINSQNFTVYVTDISRINLINHLNKALGMALIPVPNIRERNIVVPKKDNLSYEDYQSLACGKNDRLSYLYRKDLTEGDVQFALDKPLQKILNDWDKGTSTKFKFIWQSLNDLNLTHFEFKEDFIDAALRWVHRLDFEDATADTPEARIRIGVTKVWCVAFKRYASETGTTRIPKLD